MITDANAFEVTSIPFAPARFSPKLPVITMTSAVSEHTTIVSIKGDYTFRLDPFIHIFEIISVGMS